MSAKKQAAPTQAPTLQIRVWFGGEVVATGEVTGGLNAMKGAK
jgi:hypothetical protein